MDGPLWWLAQNTLTIALAIAVVALLCRLTPRRPALHHLLWLVVLLKFLTPPVVVWPWTVDDLAQRWRLRTTRRRRTRTRPHLTWSAIRRHPRGPSSLEGCPPEPRSSSRRRGESTLRRRSPNPCRPRLRWPSRHVRWLRASPNRPTSMAPEAAGTGSARCCLRFGSPARCWPRFGKLAGFAVFTALPGVRFLLRSHSSRKCGPSQIAWPSGHPPRSWPTALPRRWCGRCCGWCCCGPPGWPARSPPIGA